MRLMMILVFLLGTLGASAQDAPIPEPMPIVDEAGHDVLNILLIGNATNRTEGASLTDTMLLVSYDRATSHIGVVSLPRDLYVYLPNMQLMGKLNQAYYFGEKNPSDGFDGLDELKATLLYNLGVQIDYTARINFDGFIRLIDSLGGVEMSIDCAIQDWRLLSPELDKTVAENYAKFTLDAGVTLLDGDTALWYVRSRKTSTDLDRGRRQQDVLRAIWRTIRARGALQTLPTLWNEWANIVTTDMPLEVALGLVPDALQLETSAVDYYTFRIKQHVDNGYTPDAAQRYILVPNRTEIAALMQTVVLPTTQNQVVSARPRLAIINGTGSTYYDYLTRIAADRLELEGFRTEVITEATSARDFNHIVDLVGEEKGSPLERLMRATSTTLEGVEIAPDANRDYDYKLYIGSNYAGYACTRPIIPPTPDATATPNG